MQINADRIGITGDHGTVNARGRSGRVRRSMTTPIDTSTPAGSADGDFSVRSATAGVREFDAVGSALNSSAIRLDDLLARERAFSADASHQLRTPLAGVRLRLEAALDSPDDDLRQAVQDGIAAADRLEQTTHEFLLLAREQPGRRGEAISVTSLTREIQTGWGSRLAAHGRSLAIHVESLLPTPRASAASTRQVPPVFTLLLAADWGWRRPRARSRQLRRFGACTRSS